MAERYSPVGCTDFGQAIDAIFAARPSFVFNTLIGESSVPVSSRSARRLLQPRRRSGARVPGRKLYAVRAGARGDRTRGGRRPITSSVYFSSLDTPENHRFVKAYHARFPDGPVVSADAEATYLAVRLLALAVTEAGTVEACAVKRAAALRSSAPQGEVRIDAETMHASLTPRIACSTPDGGFTVLREATLPAPADPYLIRNSSRFGAVAIRPCCESPHDDASPDPELSPQPGPALGQSRLQRRRARAHAPSSAYRCGGSRA